MQRTFDITDTNIKLNLGICHLNSNEKQIAFDNPHCTEYFCNLQNISDCTNCTDYLLSKHKLKLYNPNYLPDNTNNDSEYCEKNCTNGYIYDYINRDKENVRTSEIDKIKLIEHFYQKSLCTSLDEIPYNINYEYTFPKPKTVVHWGQLKMLLITIIFFNIIIEPDDEKVIIIYPGSARGDDILLLCKMYPNTIWYLIDPHKHHEQLYNHPQIKEIIESYFTNELANKYYNLFKNRNHKLLFISDIRSNTDDESIISDQQQNIDWHTILQPDYSYLKFRCPYNIKKYEYYKGTIFIQPYAPISSTETRLLLTKEIEKCTYNCEKYQAKLFYFNRILRPSYYSKSLINNNMYFDHCYDCTYFAYIIQDYLKKFKHFNFFKTSNLQEIMKFLTQQISKYTMNKIAVHNQYVRNNLLYTS